MIKQPQHSGGSANGGSICIQTDLGSVATVMTDVFQKNEVNLLRKFGKIVRIFDKVDDSKNRGVI